MSSLMRSIEVDFEVHQAIELERTGFDDPPNSALRRLLKLDPPDKPTVQKPVATDGGKLWTKRGVELRDGTELRVKYSEVEAIGRVLRGKLTFDGSPFRTPSAAVAAVVERRRGSKVTVNGWDYVYARRPGEREWRSLAQLRSRAALDAVAEKAMAVASAAKKPSSIPVLGDQSYLGYSD